jgi:hypothetical protein
VPNTFVSKLRRTFSIGISATGPVCITPALLMSTSTSFANAACRSPSSVISSTWIFSCTPASSATFISSVTCGAICTPAITVCPRFASASAVPLPNPVAAPVTKIRFVIA